MYEGLEMSPGELLSKIVNSPMEERLRICEGALVSSVAANKCFMAGHEVEIDNLKRTIVDLSAALVEAASGRLVDPVLVATAQNAVDETLASASSDSP